MQLDSWNNQPTAAAVSCARNGGSMIELIEQINSTLQIHRNDRTANRPEPDAFVIEQYEYRRSQYLSVIVKT